MIAIIEKIQSIIDIIRRFNKNNYPNNNVIKCVIDNDEYNRIGYMYIDILEQKFNSINKNNNEIIFIYNEIVFNVVFKNINNIIYCYIIYN
jgi:hypothetical protein